MKVKIDADKVRYYQETRCLTYEDIAICSNGVFNINSLKYALNSGLQLPEEKADLLAQILDCELDDILEDGFIRTKNIPARFILLTKSLYLEQREDINTFYKALLAVQMRSIGFQNLTTQCGGFYEIFTRPSLEDDPTTKIVLAREFILATCSPNGDAFSAWIGLNQGHFSYYLARLTEEDEGYSSHLVVLVFLYVFFLFESIFLEELVASAVQLSSERRSNVVDQYYAISIPLENLKSTYLDFMLHSPGLRFDGSKFIFGHYDEQFYEDILVLVLACNECLLHLDSDFVASQYVNRKVMHGIVTRILRTASRIGVYKGSESSIDFTATRFGQRYLSGRQGKQQFLNDERERQKQLSFERAERQKQANFERMQEQRQTAFENKLFEAWFMASLETEKKVEGSNAETVKKSRTPRKSKGGK